MAVPPANGAIYLSKIALEKAYDNYAHSSAWTTLETSSNKISLKHVTIGGAPHAGYYNAGESPEGFEATNTTSPSYPNNSAPYGMQEFLQYDHDYVARIGKQVYTTSVPKGVFACGQDTDGTWYFPDTTPAVNDQVYTQQAPGTSTPSAGKYGYKNIGSGDTDYRFEVDSNGVITSVNSC